MPEIHITAEKAMAAPADQVYACISDFKQHHSNFLPPAFSDVKVEEGGVGEGTVLSFVMTAGGRQRPYRMKVAEPEPGKIMTESDTNSSLVTTWTVTPQGTGSLVRLDTRWNGRGGMAGFMERLFAPPAMRKLYTEELGLLDTYSQKVAAGTA